MKYLLCILIIFAACLSAPANNRPPQMVAIILPKPVAPMGGWALENELLNLKNRKK